MVVGGKPYGGRGKSPIAVGGKFYAQMTVTNTVKKVFSLALRELVMRITKLYASGNDRIPADVRRRKRRTRNEYSRQIACTSPARTTDLSSACEATLASTR